MDDLPRFDREPLPTSQEVACIVSIALNREYGRLRAHLVDAFGQGVETYVARTVETLTRASAGFELTSDAVRSLEEFHECEGRVSVDDGGPVPELVLYLLPSLIDHALGDGSDLEAAGIDFWLDVAEQSMLWTELQSRGGVVPDREEWLAAARKRETEAWLMWLDLRWVREVGRALPPEELHRAILVRAGCLVPIEDAAASRLVGAAGRVVPAVTPENRPVQAPRLRMLCELSDLQRRATVLAWSCWFGAELRRRLERTSGPEGAGELLERLGGLCVALVIEGRGDALHRRIAALRTEFQRAAGETTDQRLVRLAMLVTSGLEGVVCSADLREVVEFGDTVRLALSELGPAVPDTDDPRTGERDPGFDAALNAVVESHLVLSARWVQHTLAGSSNPTEARVAVVRHSSSVPVLSRYWS